MKKADKIIKDDLPITDIEQLTRLFAEFILWYDKPHCKGIDGAHEIVGEYLGIEALEQNQQSSPTEGEIFPPLTDKERERCLNPESWNASHQFIKDISLKTGVEMIRINEIIGILNSWLSKEQKGTK